MKVYDKHRKSTPYLTSGMDTYLPIIDRLHNRTPLRGKMLRLIPTLTGEYRCEDENNIFILSGYIEGETVGERDLTDEQVFQLADTVSALHSLDIPNDIGQVTETFDMPFYFDKLSGWAEDNWGLLKSEIKDILQPHGSGILRMIDRSNELSAILKGQKLEFCLCHTDIHHWNIIVNGGNLFLIDWEGIRFAPAEADIFSIYRQPYFDTFMDRYLARRPGFKVSETALDYYLLNRKLQDIYEFTEQLQFDDLTGDKFTTNLTYLKGELDSIG